MKDTDPERERGSSRGWRMLTAGLAIPVATIILALEPEGASYVAAAVLAYDLVMRAIKPIERRRDGRPNQ